jgi:hypothetical protein
MNVLTIDLDSVRSRMSAGEALAAIARELSVPWQRLSKALRGKGALADQTAAPPDVTKTPRRPAKPLAERVRPQRLADIAGQEAAVTLLRAFAANPYPAAFVFSGETGTGKTSAAVALAGELGCDLACGEFGGVFQIASGDQTADAVRETIDRMAYATWSGSGWKVLIVNEADRMGRPAETVWLDRLEFIPEKAVIIFTTNEADRLAQRFQDRCTSVTFESSAARLKTSGRAFIGGLYRRETGHSLSSTDLDALFKKCLVEHKFSFRRAVFAVQEFLLLLRGSVAPADQERSGQ